MIQHQPLTAREREVLSLLAEGCQQKVIAEKLGVSAETVKKHLKNSYRKLGSHNKLEALRKAGII